MAKKGTIIEESQLSDFMSMSGKGKNFPSGRAIRYYPKKIIIENPGGKPIYRNNDGSIEITSKIKNLNKGIEVVDGKLVKKQTKRVSGRATPTGKGAAELRDQGNIDSKFGLGTQTMKSDLELLREERKKQGKRIEKAKKEKFREKEEKSLKKKKFSRGGMIDYRSKGLFK